MVDLAEGLVMGVPSEIVFTAIVCFFFFDSFCFNDGFAQLSVFFVAGDRNCRNCHYWY